ncbi:hypothetical protein ACEWY4_007784 [Coilia grayii]|uniref:Transposase domain-containing protein n=1 Tax=Coilia grayii TaxID=363190 RepID=A0ABD1K923_9TELE
MNRKTAPVSLHTIRRRTRVDVQKRLDQIRDDMTDMDVAGIGRDDTDRGSVLLENSIVGAAEEGGAVFIEEEHGMELEAESLADVCFDGCPGTSGSECDDDVDLNETSLSDNIANWATSFGISLVALTALLGILRITHPNLPKDGRTLLRTKTQYAIQEKAGGQYYHFGILTSLKATLTKFAKTLVEGMTLGLQINIDGLPLFKSSTVQLWPILGLLVSVPMKEPVVIGVYCGPKKPSSATEFLSDFVSELKELEGGFCFGDTFFKIELHTVVCDSPARAFAKNTKAHNAYHGCDKCIHPGLYQNRRMTFPGPEYPQRTDRSFNLQVDEVYHHEGPHPFQHVKVGMVSQFPLDYMHLVCLGVVKKLLQIWLRGPLPVRLPASIVGRMSEKLLSMRPYIPVEFARKPRSFRELDRWKATEFRQFLLYSGPVVLAGFLDNNMYHNFMVLSAAISILVHPHHDLLDYAGEMLKGFVQHFGELYGTDHIVYNVHCLVHLVDDVKRHGGLYSFSAVPYENHLAKLKKQIRKAEFPLAQIIPRLSESPENTTLDMNIEKKLKKEHFVGPAVLGMQIHAQYGEMHTERWTIKITTGDNIFVLGKKVCVIKNIVKNADGVHVVYSEFAQQSPFFNYPFSSDRINICVARHLSEQLMSVEVSALHQKCVALPHRDGFVAIPLLH